MSPGLPTPPPPPPLPGMAADKSIEPSDFSRRIEGPLLAGYSNVTKDRSFQQYLVLDILTNPDRVTLSEKR